MKSKQQFVFLSLISVVLSMFMAISLQSIALADITSPQPTTNCPSGYILTLKPWYDGLLDGQCQVDLDGDIFVKAWIIGLNIIEDLLQLSGYVAVGFVIYGGFLYMMSSGSPDKAIAARKTIVAALIGLVVAIFAVTLINLVVRNALGLKPTAAPVSNLHLLEEIIV